MSEFPYELPLDPEGWVGTPEYEELADLRRRTRALKNEMRDYERDRD